MNQIFNFSSGPAMIPSEVLLHVQKELCNWHDIGISAMEISHRSKEFLLMAHNSEQDLRDLLSIPEYYKVLFCSGGARTQFAAIPLNILSKQTSADYINSGYWGQSASQESKKYCQPKLIDVTTQNNNIRGVLPMSQWELSDDSSYVHYCPNETIDGISIDESPDFGNRVVVGDFSSTILSRPIDISRFGIIYASAQKNIGPAGLTLVIVREDLLGRARKEVPSVLNYQVISDHKSMFNTPPTFAWYISGLVLKWLKTQGGLTEIHKRNQIKADLVYRTIDDSIFYHNSIAVDNRSCMNITFKLANSNMDSLFIEEAEAAGLYSLKGHNTIGGMRASIYNAMPLEGVQKLVSFMKHFASCYS